jgi:tRNA pseudouridine38-40 synthase
MPNFKLTIAYDGTAFVGWQRQATGVSIQGLIEDALSELDAQPVAVTAAGRTDAGVHARGQVASASLQRPVDPATLVRAANARLPPAIRVVDAVPVPADFHARFHARSKRYRYRIWNAEVMSPFERAYAWHVGPSPLDCAAMAEAASVLEGRHDFAAFQAAGGDTHSTTRTIVTSQVDGGGEGRHGAGGALVVYEISGDGFLRHMVRNIVGTLVDVGRGRRAPEWVSEVLASRDRARAGATAPPEGLFLMAVSFEL